MVVGGGLGTREVSLGAVVMFHHSIGVPNQSTDGGQEGRGQEERRREWRKKGDVEVINFLGCTDKNCVVIFKSFVWQSQSTTTSDC